MLCRLLILERMDYFKQDNFHSEALRCEKQGNSQIRQANETIADANGDLQEKKTTSDARQKRLEKMMEDVKNFIRQIDVETL